MEQEIDNAGVAQLVERKPSKLDVAGSSPVSRSCNEGRMTDVGTVEGWNVGTVVEPSCKSLLT